MYHIQTFTLSSLSLTSLIMCLPYHLSPLSLTSLIIYFLYHLPPLPFTSLLLWMIQYYFPVLSPWRCSVPILSRQTPIKLISMDCFHEFKHHISSALRNYTMQCPFQKAKFKKKKIDIRFALQSIFGISFPP